MGAISKEGYGIVYIGSSRKDYKTTKAHRFSYELYKGKIPKGMLVCHSCDNRGCVNPDHLWLGIIQENNQDMIKKNRGRYPGPYNPTRGELSGQAKLTQEQVLNIRKRYKIEKCTGTKLAEEYGVFHSTIYNILNNKRWKHLN